MVTYKKRLQMLFHEYQDMKRGPGTLRDVIEWALQNDKIPLPQIDPRKALISDLKDALQTEKRVDAHGNEYRANAAVTFTNDGGIQDSWWGDVDRITTEPHFMLEHFGQRRKGILADCMNLKKDVDHYNGIAGEQLGFRLILDFTDDVAEREALNRVVAA